MKRTLFASMVLVGVLSLLIVGAATLGVAPDVSSATGGDSTDVGDLEATMVSEEATSDDYELSVEIEPATAGGETTVSPSLTNYGDDRTGVAINATVPDDWRVVDYEADGATVRASTVDWLWLEQKSGTTVAPSVTVELPDDGAGEYELTVTASDPEGNDVTVDVTVPVEAAD